jgi:hypothetical protein
LKDWRNSEPDGFDGYQEGNFAHDAGKGKKRKRPVIPGRSGKAFQAGFF